jgi:hypothetical protein
MPLDATPYNSLRESQQIEREKFVNALRTTKRQQIRGSYGELEHLQACAIGVYILDVVKMAVPMFWYKCLEAGQRDTQVEIARALGISYEDVSTIFMMNDHLHKTFAEIADFVENLEFVDEKLCYPSDY